MHLTRETRNKIGLTIFGLTLFPAVVYGLKALLIDSPATFSDDLASFYRSLLDMGWDGMVAWGIACGPYMVYEIILLVRSFTPRSSHRDIDELKSVANRGR
ncbi:hypothetical protein DSCO28_71160 [Desulfosarcina ovata subsp. sediminis]|uniref:Uncharacterized protein n=1 Tax=Desulfosarcina ovata subsp. sediminis TaxID=885957 RepID=A0A5K8A2N6_9BACT|nr:hypothetical protein [Desulfosarcina ovata]BBO86550.1 hypothetical protein DSCO28_71160 [Desulfosarcina ovata subsp. sediminis]